MLETTVKELASRTKEQIDGLRADMAAAGNIQDAHTINIEALHNLVHGWATDFGNFEKRVRNLETCGVIRDKAIADVVRGLMRYLDVDRDKMMECIKAAKEDYEKMIFEMPQSRRRKDTEDIYLSSATRKLPQMPRNYVEKAMAACGIPIRYKEGEEGKAEYRIISREDVQKLADYIRMFLPKEGKE